MLFSCNKFRYILQDGTPDHDARIPGKIKGQKGGEDMAKKMFQMWFGKNSLK